MAIYNAVWMVLYFNRNAGFYSLNIATLNKCLVLRLFQSLSIYHHLFPKAIIQIFIVRILQITKLNIRSVIKWTKDKVKLQDYLEKKVSPTLRCVLQLRISCPQWAVFNGVKGQTSVIVQSDPSISISGSLLLGEIPNNCARGFEQTSRSWSGASSWGNKRCTSQQTRITIVELVRRWPLADLV